ncbi:hypothetical protein AB1N83_005263 [Pleurotus pulmonarius]
MSGSRWLILAVACWVPSKYGTWDYAKLTSPDYGARNNTSTANSLYGGYKASDSLFVYMPVIKIQIVQGQVKFWIIIIATCADSADSDADRRQ